MVMTCDCKLEADTLFTALESNVIKHLDLKENTYM
jgi:hypothetical protein